MARLVLYLVILVGIGYGAYSLFFADSDPESPGNGGDTPKPASGDGGGEPAATERIPALLEEAEEVLVGARAAETRTAAQDQKDRARRLLSEALLLDPGGEGAGALRKRIERLNDEVLFSEEALAGRSFLHEFRPTDRLWTLVNKGFPEGRQVSVSAGFLLWMNGISDARSIQAGRLIKVTTEKLSLLVIKSRFELWVLLGGVYLKSFKVGIGKDDKTPEGTFTIQTLQENPVWWRDGRKIPFGHRDNPLGTRWLGFRPTPRATGYGIHGTTEPGSIGTAVSEGCVRLRNEDVEELFDWVKAGTEVVILR